MLGRRRFLAGVRVWALVGVRLATVAGMVGMAGAGIASVAPAASAVENNTFSITPTGERTSIVMTADARVRTDRFVLHDLRSRPITIALAVFSLRPSGSTYTRVPPTGFGAGVRLPAPQVQLRGRETKVLPVRINTHYRAAAEQFAVIDAHTVPAPHSASGAAHLQLVIELKPLVVPTNGTGSSTGDDIATGVAAGLILLGLLLQLAAARRRRQRPAGLP